MELDESTTRRSGRIQKKEWCQEWLAHELCHHGMVMSVKPRQSKLKNSKASDHESDTNYDCWLTDPELASGGSRKGWAALFGYSRFKDRGLHPWMGAVRQEVFL